MKTYPASSNSAEFSWKTLHVYVPGTKSQATSIHVRSNTDCGSIDNHCTDIGLIGFVELWTLLWR